MPRQGGAPAGLGARGGSLGRADADGRRAPRRRPLDQRQAQAVTDRPGRFQLDLLGEAEAQAYLGVNRYQDVLWYNQEAFDELLSWLYITAAVDLTTATEQTAQLAAERLQACHDVIKQLQKAEKASDFQIEKLLEAVKGS